MVGVIGDQMKRLFTIHESPIGPVNIFLDEDQESVIVSASGGWMFAKRHTGDDGVQLDFGHVRIEDDVRVK
jgi:hypothetical protein